MSCRPSALGGVHPGQFGYELIVRGRVDSTRRALVKYKGEYFVRATPCLAVDEVLLRPQELQVGEHIRLTWANQLGISCPVIALWRARYASGVWFVRLTFTRVDAYLMAPEEAFFVPDGEGTRVRAMVASLPPYAVAASKVDEHVLLHVRYHNPSDRPRELTSWRVAEEGLFVPTGCEFSFTRRVWGGEPETVLRAQPLDAGQTEIVRVEPRCYVEDRLDVTHLLEAYRSDNYEGLHVHLLVDGSDATPFFSGLYVPDDVAQERYEPDSFIQVAGPAGSVVWWFPSAGNLAVWMAVSVPLLSAAALWLWRKGASHCAYSLLGTCLGLVWAWALAAWAPEATVGPLGLVRRPSAELGAALAGMGRGDWLWAAAVWASLLLVPLGAACVAFCTRKSRRARGAWLIWSPWVALPVAVAGIHLVVLGPMALV